MRWASDDAEKLEAAWGRVQDFLLKSVFSDFFVAMMSARGTRGSEDLPGELLALDREVRGCIASAYQRKPQEIALGKEYNATEFDRGSSKSMAADGAIRPGCICGVQQWGYTAIESPIIYERARVDVVDDRA
jgi:hypothetical protein